MGSIGREYGRGEEFKVRRRFKVQFVLLPFTIG